jgi:hypothetical protein
VTMLRIDASSTRLLPISMWLLFGPALTACAHTGGISDMGAGVYAVTGTESGTEQRGTAVARADAVDQATAFCAKSGRKRVIQAYDGKPLMPGERLPVAS